MQCVSLWKQGNSNYKRNFVLFLVGGTYVLNVSKLFKVVSDSQWRLKALFYIICVHEFVLSHNMTSVWSGLTSPCPITDWTLTCTPLDRPCPEYPADMFLHLSPPASCRNPLSKNMISLNISQQENIISC
jgi:hypothetical protein